MTKAEPSRDMLLNYRLLFLIDLVLVLLIMLYFLKHYHFIRRNDFAEFRATWESILLIFGLLIRFHLFFSYIGALWHIHRF